MESRSLARSSCGQCVASVPHPIYPSIDDTRAALQVRQDEEDRKAAAEYHANQAQWQACTTYHDTYTGAQASGRDSPNYRVPIPREVAPGTTFSGAPGLVGASTYAAEYSAKPFQVLSRPSPYVRGSVCKYSCCA